ALPAYGQPRFRRNHRPPRSNREMAGCPARKSRSTWSWPILRCRSSMTFCASPTAGALLPRANSSPARFTSSCFQSLIIVGLTPNSADSSARVFSPESAAIATRALNSALCCFLLMPTSYAPLDRSAFSLSHCPKIRSRRTDRAHRGQGGRGAAMFVGGHAVHCPGDEVHIIYADADPITNARSGCGIQHHVCRLFTDHDRRRIGVARCQR